MSKPETQLESLRRRGYLGSMRDPFWNAEKGIHECCGAPRYYYHRIGCPACVGPLVERVEPPPTYEGTPPPDTPILNTMNSKTPRVTITIETDLEQAAQLLAGIQGFELPTINHLVEAPDTSMRTTAADAITPPQVPGVPFELEKTGGGVALADVGFGFRICAKCQKQVKRLSADGVQCVKCSKEQRAAAPGDPACLGCKQVKPNLANGYCRDCKESEALFEARPDTSAVSNDEIAETITAPVRADDDEEAE